jgi:ABC-type multidrug transport system ATPase subunit
MNAIEIENLWKKFDGKVALKEITLNVRRGEKIAILGPNGAGKTTLLKVLAGQLKPSKGDARVLGFQPWKKVEVRRKIGFVSHSSLLYKDLTALENLRFYSELYDSDFKAEELLKIVGIYEQRNLRLSAFSKGMEQRLAIARAILADPEILLLDELTSGLDLEGRRLILGYIKENFADKTILMAGHDFEELEEICEEGILLNGEIKMVGEISEIKRLMGSDYEKSL